MKMNFNKYREFYILIFFMCILIFTMIPLDYGTPLKITLIGERTTDALEIRAGNSLSLEEFKLYEIQDYSSVHGEVKTVLPYSGTLTIKIEGMNVIVNKASITFNQFLDYEEYSITLSKIDGIWQPLSSEYLAGD